MVIQHSYTLKDLGKRINTAQSAIVDPDNPTVYSSELEAMMMMRDEMLENATRDSIDRNRARWKHFPERSTSYVHGLNRRYRIQTPLTCVAPTHSGGATDIFSDKTSKMLHECNTFLEPLITESNGALQTSFYQILI